MSEVKERPIIFSTEMVKAILDGRKTMTRRVVRPQIEQSPNAECDIKWGFQYYHKDHLGELVAKCPYGQVGDRLWVRETFWYHIGYLLKPQPIKPSWPVIYYDTDTDPNDFKTNGYYRKHPSLFMPRWASRITLEITGVKVGRVQEISTRDKELMAEGIPLICLSNNKTDWAEMAYQFSLLWDSLNAKRGYGWESNPWCWVIQFDNIGVKP